MKGLEVTFRGKIVSGVMDENYMDVGVEKRNDGDYNYMQYHFGGLKKDDNDEDLFYTLDYAEDLKTGDEIIIRKKEIDTISEPVYLHPEYPSDPDERAKMFQNMLNVFRELETKLRKSGLLD